MRTRFFTLAGLALLAACSPQHDWRAANLDHLQALLPCRPDRATRTLPVGGDTVSVDMLGCEAGGRTFAVARIAAADAARANALLAQWRGATLATLGADATDNVPRPVFHPPGSTALPGGLRQHVQGRQPGGQPVAADAAWFAHLPAGGAPGAVYQALVLAPPGDSAAPLPDGAADTFFDGLRVAAP